VEERELNYYTDAVVKFDIKVLSEDERAERAGVPAVVGDILVRSQAEKFKKLRFHTHENIGYGEIYLPPEEMQTRAVTLLFPEGSPGGDALAAMHDELARGAALAGILQLLRSLSPAWLLCDSGDLGGAWRVRDDHFGVPAIYVWDRYPGGTGLAEALGPLLDRVLGAARERLAACDCSSGCPSCAGLDEADAARPGARKPGARKVLDAVLAGPHGTEERIPPGAGRAGGGASGTA